MPSEFQSPRRRGINPLARHLPFLLGLLVAAGPPLSAQRLAPRAGMNPLDTVCFAPQRLGVWFSRLGAIGHNPRTDNSGIEWPTDSDRYLSFGGGFILVGRVADTARATGTWYWQNVSRPGPIHENRQPADSADARFRIFRLRHDRPSDADWREWPGAYGAPVTKDGTPLLFGEDQIYYVSNDLDTARIRWRFRSDPLAVEWQTTAWTSAAPVLSDVMFIRNRFINKGGDTLKDAYVVFFDDHDIGDVSDDYAGSDSLLSLVYGYGGRPNDAVYGVPPAFGIAMVQTPRVSAGVFDSARWAGGFIRGWRNAAVAAAVAPLKNYGADFHEPYVSDPPARWLKLAQGSGMNEPMINPKTGTPTAFWFSGDPVSGTGWTMQDGFRDASGLFYPENPADKRMAISAGPFSFAPGDTQEVVIALAAAGGLTWKESVSNLRSVVAAARRFHRVALSGDLRMDETPPPVSYIIAVSPHPVRTQCVVEFVTSASGPVRLDLLDLNGRCIRTLVGATLRAGSHGVSWDGNAETGEPVASGTYVLQLATAGMRAVRQVVILR